MAKQIEGVYDKVVEYAKKEFLEKGFKDASLREIASHAGTSTSSIYTRFHDKEGLFRAIVEPAAKGLKDMFCQLQEDFHQSDSELQRNTVVDYSANSMEHVFEYIYEYFTEFQLLLDSSYGTIFENYTHELVVIEVEYTYKYMEVIGMADLRPDKLNREFLHIVTTAYLNGIFEVVRHNMKKEDARVYVKMLGDYHRAGFKTIYNCY